MTENSDILIDIDIGTNLQTVVLQENNPIGEQQLNQELPEPENNVPEEEPIEPKENAVARDDHNYVIVSYDQYAGYQKAIWKYEAEHPRYNISSILFMPLFMLIKILGLLKDLTIDILKYIVVFIGGMLVLLELFARRYYETFINIYMIISISLCMSYNNDNYVSIVLLTLCLGNSIRCLLGNTKFLIVKILGTTITIRDLDEARVKRTLTFALVTKLSSTCLYITNLLLTIKFNNTNYIALLSTGLAIEILYYALFPYYIKHRCTNIVLLERYGLKDKIDAILDNKVKTDVDRLMPLVSKKHICNNEYNGMCSKCPCAICYDTLDDVSELKCGHIYHTNCIRQSIIYEYQKYNKAECPACRTKLI